MIKIQLIIKSKKKLISKIKKKTIILKFQKNY